jgi:hypothetical protein
VKKFQVLIAGCSLLRAEGFSCSLGVLLLRPRDKQIAIFDKKNINFFSFKFFPSFGHQNSVSRTGSESGSASGTAIIKNAGSGSVSESTLNQSGSATLAQRHNVFEVLKQKHLNTFKQELGIIQAPLLGLSSLLLLVEQLPNLRHSRSSYSINYKHS